MYKQFLKRKSLSPVLSFFCIIIFVLLLTACYILVNSINAILKQSFFDPTAITLTIFLLFYLIVYFTKKHTFSSFEYEFKNDTLSIKQYAQKRLVKEVLIKREDIIEIKKGKGGLRLYNYGQLYTLVTKTKVYTIAPDNMLLGLLNGNSFTDEFIDKEFENLFFDLKGLIAIPSVKEDAIDTMPFGKPCADALNYALSLCEKLGFRTKNLDNYCGFAEIGDGEKIIAILCHLDIVPAGDGWNTDPFTAIIKDDELFGRGAIDDKGPAIAAIYAVNAVKNEFDHIPCRIRLIFGCDEESGWECMERYNKTEETPHVAFTPDAEYPVIITEKGIAQYVISGSLLEGKYQLYLEGGIRANMVPDKAKATILGDIDSLIDKINQFESIPDKVSFYKHDDALIIESSGVGAHGSTPEKGVNAFFELFKFINKLNLKGSQGTFIKDMLNIFVDKTDGSGASLSLCDDVSGELSLNLGMCFIGKNRVFKDMLDDTLRLIVDIRYPVSYSINDISSRIQSALPDSWECDVLHHQAPHHVDKDSFLVKTLMSVYKEYTKRDDQPISIGGGTYARTLPNKAVAFGVQFPDRPDKAHQPNESVLLSDLKISAKMFAASLKQLINEEK